MKLTGEEARNVVYEESLRSEWEAVSGEEIIDTSRWSIIRSRVFKHVPTGKTYMFSWSQGATECQDEAAYEYEDFYEPVEVKEEEVLIKKWVPKGV